MFIEVKNVTTFSIETTNVHNFMHPWNSKIYRLNEKSYPQIFTNDLYVDIQR